MNNLEMVEKPEDRAMRRKIDSLRRQSEDWEYQQRECVARVEEGQQQEAQLVRLMWALRQPEVARVVNGIVERNKRQSVYTSSGILTRGQQSPLAAMQADLARDNRRWEELRRRVQRERAGYR